ncbi:methyltransferase domain-containing protein [bacterium]|nr:methyltransferase domain-containing protein [bacterium]
MTEPVTDREAIVRAFFPGTGHSYDRVVHWFTLGLDYYWKRAMYQRIRTAKRILDLACGTGIVTTGLAKRFPEAEIVGVDITADYLDVYQERIKKNGIKAQFVLANAETVKLSGQFDTIVSSYIPKYVDPDKMLANIMPHVISGGIIVLHDFTLPPNPLARGIWNIYNRCMNFVGIRFFQEWREVFDAGLTMLIRKTLWFDNFPAALQRHGFDNIHRQYLSFGSSGIIWATKL